MASMAHELFDGRASLLLAEELDADYTTALVRCFDSKRTARGRLMSAWSHIEHGLCMEVDSSPDSRDYYMESAQSLLAMVHEKTEAHQDTHLEAMVLSTYLPLFRKRSKDLTPTSDDCVDIYASLGWALAYLKPFQENAIPPSVTLETTTLALSARMRQPDMLLFPTSPREEASHSQAVNHDSYFVSSGVKLPIQQKLVATDKNYSEQITMLTLMPIIDKAYKKYWRDEGLSTAEKLNTVISLIIAEVHEEHLAPWEKGCLDQLSRGVASHYRQAASCVSFETAA